MLPPIQLANLLSTVFPGAETLNLGAGYKATSSWFSLSVNWNSKDDPPVTTTFASKCGLISTSTCAIDDWISAGIVWLCDGAGWVGSASAIFASKSPSETRYRSTPNIWFQPSGISNERPGSVLACSSLVPPFWLSAERRPGPGHTCTTDSLNSVRMRSSWSHRKLCLGAMAAGNAL